MPERGHDTAREKSVVMIKEYSERGPWIKTSILDTVDRTRDQNQFQFQWNGFGLS